MKYLWSFLGILCVIGMTILYFQLIVSITITVPFFSAWIDISVFSILLILLAFCGGMFITLAVKGFMSGSNNIDDDFDL